MQGEPARVGVAKKAVHSSRYWARFGRMHAHTLHGTLQRAAELRALVAMFKSISLGAQRQIRVESYAQSVQTRIVLFAPLHRMPLARYSSSNRP